ncbi:hypothetical protein C1H46_028483 [Malus baccata]|uniref:Integrase catalytic domain-containing protein n=1 Tax=Malus baccata TaxID=106549 RepID=A0A540LHI9_MALBA|nr:hypothetical protein C1H46_028483 [Malus baccata]
MAGSGSGDLRAPVFYGTEFKFWKVRMVTIFKSYGIWKLVDKGIVIPESKKKGEKKKTKKEKEEEDSSSSDDDEGDDDELDAHMEDQLMKDAKALGIIQSAVSKEIFPRIVNQETSKGAWDLLQEEFRGDEQARSVKLQSLRREFEYMRMKENESLSIYLTRLFELMNQMKSYGDNLTHQREVQKVLISLSSKYDPICVVIKRTSDLNTVTVQEVVGSLKSYELRLSRHVDEITSTEHAFSTMGLVPKTQNRPLTQGNHSKGKKNWKSMSRKWENNTRQPERQGEITEGVKQKCKICDKAHHGECWFKGKPKCHNCNRFGHVVRDCHQPKKNHTANYLNHVQDNAMMFYACHKASVQENSGVWYLDSGCSNHMTSTESLLINIDRSIRCKVKMGTGELVDSVGKGTLIVETKRGTRFIPEVMIVPGLDENLLSVGQMVEHGYWLLFGNFMACIFGDCELQDHIATVKMKGNGCFPLMFNHVDHFVANIATTEGNTWKWHRRFGHLNYDSLRLLQERSIVYGLPYLKEYNQVCEGCATGKAHREAFSKEQKWRAKLPLELVHTDVCGPMSETLRGSRYFLTFIDDKSRMCWVYFLKCKSEVFRIFKMFKAMTELQTGYKLKKIRSDRGGEYTSLEFEKFCEDVGIEKQLTVAYSPQQNGIAERKNRTIVEMARTMLYEKKITTQVLG